MNEKKFKIFQRLICFPYLLAIFGLFMPLANVSCAETNIAEPNLYELAVGYDLSKELKEPAGNTLKKMEQGNPKLFDNFKSVMPNFPKLEPMYHLFGIVIALILAIFFAFIAPLGYYASLGSLTMGILSMVSLWAVLSQIGTICNQVGMNVLSVEPAYGIYCDSFLILIGTAMNLASIAKPIFIELKQKKKK